MKDDDERGGPRAVWAYHSRDSLHLSPEQVVDRLGKYDAGTLRKAESDERHMSKPLWRALSGLYPEVAHEKGIAIPPPPGGTPSRGGSGESSGALVVALEGQTRAINRLIDRLDSLTSAAIRDGVMDALREAGLTPNGGGSRDEPPPGSQP